MMKIKYQPIAWCAAGKKSLPDYTQPETEIKVIDENTISVDSQLYEFNPTDIVWNGVELRQATNGLILEAYRELDVLYLTIRRFYIPVIENTVALTPDWATGDFHEVTT